MLRKLCAGGLVAAAVLFSSLVLADPVEERLIDGLEYRLVGPWRGGRVTAVHAAPGARVRVGSLLVAIGPEETDND